MLLFLLLGAIINVAVAWGFGANTRVTWSDDGPPNAENIEWWQTTAPAGSEISSEPARVIHSRGFAYSGVYMVELRRTESTQPTGHICQRHMIGWPMRSLQSTTWENGGRIVAVRGIAVFLSPVLPIEPLWIGTIINSLFYGVILFIPWTAVIGLRKRSRIRRGLCPNCKYPIGPSDTCTECGKPIPIRGRKPNAETQKT